MKDPHAFASRFHARMPIAADIAIAALERAQSIHEWIRHRNHPMTQRTPDTDDDTASDRRDGPVDANYRRGYGDIGHEQPIASERGFGLGAGDRDPSGHVAGPTESGSHDAGTSSNDEDGASSTRD